MSEVPSKRTAPGRPRLHETDSKKVEAFRERQEKAGFLRKEVLVTAQTERRLAELAKLHGVSVTDVASGLLEHGLSNFDKSASGPAESPLADKALPALSRAARDHTAAQTRVTPATNPIKQFFERRKGQA